MAVNLSALRDQYHIYGYLCIPGESQVDFRGYGRGMPHIPEEADHKLLEIPFVLGWKVKELIFLSNFIHYFPQEMH